LTLDRVQVQLGDTALPYGTFSGGSTTTPSMSPSARQAGEDTRKALAKIVAPALGTTPDQLTFAGGMITATNGKSITFAQGCALLSSPLVIEAERGDQSKIGSETVTGVHFAQVEVDTRTGKVRVLKVVAVHNAGRILNPLTAESQILGGVIQGLNYALFEERIMDRNLGLMMNANLEAYKVGGSKDMPEIDPVLLDVSSGGSYVGAIGLGEPPIIPTAAAIANAVYHAIGVRIYQLPITPTAVLAALGTIPASRTAASRTAASRTADSRTSSSGTSSNRAASSSIMSSSTASESGRGGSR
jgi:xanthine dehydrogenase YagR molybdenum-binding subunit